ncbi:DUF3784 domain-containing protein [Bizionia argentinensis JUB59]|uniref:DUF3784 domain-containing protein n=1 Tax=Bizionia argentinensis JUB59 TaxID=1046627 RepID=G2EAX2_9FLAO|nr:DUF3784 domain-containing protein [Bizionia argentinensis]EGV44424.1 DUF3784 domain-containing protein [Bizionia argentinensis JUB59]
MILTAVLFLVFAILIKNFKLYDLIAGYNTMPDAEKAIYNMPKIGNLLANVLIMMATIILIAYGFSKWLDNEQIGAIGISAAILIGLPYLLIKANSKAYKINSEKD